MKRKCVLTIMMVLTMVLTACTAEPKEGETATDRTIESGVEPESSLPDDVPTVTTAPQDGQIYGYMSKFDSASATIDRQLWVTSESEDWKPEYDEAAGFEVVDAEGEDIIYPLSQDCKYFILENHWYPVVELDEKEFESYLSEMEYPVLWIIQLADGRIIEIGEQYRP